MDAFYASVEKRENPALRELPVIVGADPKGGKGRGVVAGCSYEARRCGVHSAQPISMAYRLCPHGVYLRPNFDLYERVSSRIMQLLRQFSEKFEQVGIDEAYLDVSERAVTYGEAEKLAVKIKEEIRLREGLTCSIGVAPNKSIAKIASDHQKPDGLTVVEPDRVPDFLGPLPVSKISGVGEKTQKALEKLGIRTIGELAKAAPAKLSQWFGKYGVRLWEIANGTDASEVRPSYTMKSISSERTFEEDVRDRSLVLEELEKLVEEVYSRAVQENYLFRTVGIKVRFEDFSTFTRSRSHIEYTNRKDLVLECVRSLFKEFENDRRRVRLVGVRISNLRRQDELQESLLTWAEAGQVKSL